jgi:Fe-S-cluster-containing dehydrogenase component
MKRVVLLTDLDLCVGCFACETACKQEHNLPVGVRWMRVVQAGPEEIGKKLVMDFVPTHCRHCENPPCIQACSMDGITKRSDGIVIYNEDACIGCMMCIEACPFGMVQFNEEKGVAQACNMCYDRVDQGLEPACVAHCPNHALVFGDPVILSNRRREKFAYTFLQRRNPDLTV